MKKAFSMLMVVLLVFSMAFPTFAAQSSENTVQTFSDGSYCVITLETDYQTRSSTRSATKTYTYYNGDDECQWLFMVHGTFSYDGTTSEAVSAKGAYTIVNREWSLTDSEVYCQGAYAIGEAVFEHPSDGTVPITVTIYCDKNGNIS